MGNLPDGEAKYFKDWKQLRLKKKTREGERLSFSNMKSDEPDEACGGGVAVLNKLTPDVKNTWKQLIKNDVIGA